MRTKPLPLPNLSGTSHTPEPEPQETVGLEEASPVAHEPPQVHVPSKAAPKPREKVLFEGRSLKDAFVRERKLVIGTSMRQSLYDLVQEYRGGVSAFFEDAIKDFDGKLDVLIAASLRFEDLRRSGSDPRQPVNGRVTPQAYKRVNDFLKEAQDQAVKRVSHAKIVGGFAQLWLEKLESSK